jgi:hypothetical protein
MWNWDFFKNSNLMNLLPVKLSPFPPSVWLSFLFRLASPDNRKQRYSDEHKINKREIGK